MRFHKLIFILLISSVPCHATQYYMSTTGNDASAGTSTGTAWASPNHALNCGDSIQAATGAYNTNAFVFGTVTCSAGNNVAWLTCATAFGCTGSVTSGGQYSAGMQIGNSYWGVQGWSITVYSGGGQCFFVYPNTSSTTIHHIVFANNIANGCGKAGFEASINSPAGVDYFAVVGNIVYGAAAGNTECESGINLYYPVSSDTVPGTHIYYAGNFSFDNVDPNPCAGQTPTDGEGLFFDTVVTYAQQMVMDNNLSVFNGGNCIKAYSNSTANVIFRHNTCYGNETGSVNSGLCAEVGFQSSTYSQAYLNLAVTSASTACSGAVALYVLATIAGNSTNTLYSNYGYSAAGNNSSAGGSTITSNTFSNPSLSNPTNPGAPSCSSYSTTTACMATVISNFAATVTAAKTYGYQTPTTVDVFDPLFPHWLCNVSLPSGIVEDGCLNSSSLNGANVTNGKITNH